MNIDIKIHNAIVALNETIGEDKSAAILEEGIKVTGSAHNEKLLARLQDALSLEKEVKNVITQ
jgi:hypothetical protein